MTCRKGEANTPSHSVKLLALFIGYKMKRLTQEEFINRAIAVHGNKYDYSKVAYVNSRTKVCVICPTHGEFWIKPNLHIMGNKCGCPICNPYHKMNTDEFVKNAVKKHGDKYDYSLVKYVGAGTKVKILCRKHGIFEQTPASHLAGQGCPDCWEQRRGKSISMGLNGFLEKARQIHGDKYDYKDVLYVNNRTKIKIICNKCGHSFLQTPHGHIEGQGCPWCAGKKKTTEMFKGELYSIYGDKYNLDNVVYVNASTPVKLVCSKHGLFEKNPKVLLRGHGCVLCGNESAARKLSEQKRYTQEDFVRISKERHGDVYDYSQSKYIDSNSKILIICKEHGGFWQIAGEHMQGVGCPKCKGFNKSTDEFKEQLKKVHGDTYILDKVEYINAATKVCMVCKEHGEFYALPNNILKGQGCPNCYKHKGEERVERFLKKKNIKYVTQYEIPNESVLIPNKLLRVDFYLPDANAFIEYNGGQHYFPVKIFGGQKRFERQQERDYVLRKYCKEHKIKLIEIPYTEYGRVEELLSKKLL